MQRLSANQRSGLTAQRFSDQAILIDLVRSLLSLSNVMRLLVQILIIAGLIYLGWNKPFKEQVAQANRTISTKLHNLGSALQKHQDPSVRRP
jgi:predicted negative regulator of RcsB-dependent stress response